jgi:hypothetical protein
MNFFETLYACSTTIAVLASFPQIRQLLLAKRSDELNLATWTLWLGTQFVSLTYALSIHNRLLTIINAVWITFYAVMLGLITYYRRNPGGEVDRVPEDTSHQMQTDFFEE